MTAYRFVTLTCDHCGEIFDSGIDLRVSEARAHAAAEGWEQRWNTNRTRADWCGVCTGRYVRVGDTAYLPAWDVRP